MNFPPLIFFALLTSLFIRDVNTLKRCGIVDATSDPTYHLIKPCSRSKMTLVGSANTKTLQQCQRYATGKKALALNYNPSGDFQEEPSCLLFDCPEFQEEISLAEDHIYDYYSLYADPMPDSNVTCVPKVGMFKLHREKTNFTAAQDICSEEGGHLANVLSEQKTNALSDLIASLHAGKGKHMVYVGLTDSEMEGQYVNMKDEPMDCFTWRAWAPNQPRSKYKTEDCVVLTTDKNWKVVNCTLQMPFLCELTPRGPYNICEEEPAYCELAGGSPTISNQPVEIPNSQPEDHPGTDVSDIIEIPLPGVSGINSSDNDIEIMDIKNISDSTSTNITEQKPSQGANSTAPGDQKPGENSEKPEIQGIIQSERPLSDINGSSQTISTDIGSPNSIENSENNRTGNKWRPSLGPNDDVPNKINNWKPNNIKDIVYSSEGNGWRPTLNINSTNVNADKRPTTQNNWSPQSMGNVGIKKPLWIPQNTKMNDSHQNLQQGLWIPHNTNSEWISLNKETSQEGNNANNERPQTQNSHENIWESQNSKYEHELVNSMVRPESYDSKNSKEDEKWRPENVGNRETEKGNEWSSHPSNPHQSYWSSGPENKENLNSNQYQQGWRPQSTRTSNNKENNWEPSNGGPQGERKCNGWTPDGNRDPNIDSEDPWTAVENPEEQNIKDCKLNEWVAQDREPKNSKEENGISRKPTENGAKNSADRIESSAPEKNQPVILNEYRNQLKNLGQAQILNSDKISSRSEKQIENNKFFIQLNSNDTTMKMQDKQLFKSKSSTEKNQDNNEVLFSSDFKLEERNRFNNNIHATNEQTIAGTRKPFSTMVKGSKSYRKIKDPINTEGENKVKENNGDGSTSNPGNNINRTREEEKIPIIVFKLRDPTTRKCRAITYDPN